VVSVFILKGMKMLDSKYNKLALVGLLVLTACTNPKIVKLSPDTYMLAREAHGGIFASAASMKADVIREASEFAAQQGKVAVPLSAKEIPMGSGPAQWASIEYQFRVLDKDDPAVRKTQLVNNPNFIIQRTDADALQHADVKSSGDVYDALAKLDDLRKRGVLTDTEFAEQKKKLLQSSK
jgi:hypothetical protein